MDGQRPGTCHMQALRRVLTPLGTFNCPAHRGVEKARVSDSGAYRDETVADETGERLRDLMDRFDASVEAVHQIPQPLAGLVGHRLVAVRAAVAHPGLLDAPVGGAVERAQGREHPAQRLHVTGARPLSVHGPPALRPGPAVRCALAFAGASGSTAGARPPRARGGLTVHGTHDAAVDDVTD